MAAEAAASHWLDHYGECTASTCGCLKEGWKGRACPHFRSWGCTSVDELIARMKRLTDQQEKP